MELRRHFTVLCIITPFIVHPVFMVFILHPNGSTTGKTYKEAYLLDSSTFSSEQMNDFGSFRFSLPSRTDDSPLVFSADGRTVEWVNESRVIWFPVSTEAKLHSGKWFLEFHVEAVKNWQIGVGFLLDWNIEPDWSLFGYLGSSASAWSYDPYTGDIVYNTKSIHSDLPKFKGDKGVIGLELDIPKNAIGEFTFIIDGVRTPTKQMPNSGAVAIPAVCLLARGQRVTIRSLRQLDEDVLVSTKWNF
ncbi:hypothetical protein I4U23_022115 [Adineta vaga]|nr:hypothetical protein I4U23_022115 [Adineta vaga]